MFYIRNGQNLTLPSSAAIAVAAAVIVDAYINLREGPFRHSRHHSAAAASAAATWLAGRTVAVIVAFAAAADGGGGGGNGGDHRATDRARCTWIAIWICGGRRG